MEHVLREYLDHLSRRLQKALGDKLSAVYLTGSTAVGAHRPGASDIDVLVVVERAERDALERVVELCAHEALPCPAEKLELVVYERSGIADTRWSLNFDTGRATHHVGFDPSAEPEHWFVLDLAFAREHAQPLIGPPRDELIPPVSNAQIEHALVELVAWFEANEPEGASVARRRAEHWRNTGEFAPKTGLPSP